MSDTAVDPTISTGDQALLDAAREEWQMSADATASIRSEEVKDLKFESGEHWTPADLEWRRQKMKPAFTLDQMSGQIAKITNAPVQRIIVKPNGGGADAKSAAYWQGICRRIENLSQAEAVYRWARMHAIKMGRGFWRVRHDYFLQMEQRADGVYTPDVFNQDIRIEAILNQHAVYEDPRCRKLNFSDQRFAHICDDVHWSTLKRLHPKAALTTPDSMRATGDVPPTWAGEKTCRITERYWIEDVKIPLCLLTNGTVVPRGSGYPKEMIKLEHDFIVPTVWWMKYTWGEIIERPRPVAGRFIPLIKIVGERRIVEGKDDTRGMVRMAKEAQRLVDFMETRLAEVVDVATWQTIAAPQEGIEHDQDSWNSINTERPAVVTFRSRDDAGQPMQPPFVLSGRPDVGAIALAAQRASMNLRHALGVPDVTPEESRPEQSGKAIKARQAEQSQAVNHYADATAGGIAHTGEIILSQGRVIYDVPRILRIMDVSEKEIEVVTHKGKDQLGAAQQMAQHGGQAAQMRHMLDVSVGEFDVTVAAGKGYQNGREETRDVMEVMVPVMPPEMQVKAWPILVKNHDAPGMQELAEAIKPPDDPNMVPRADAEQAQQVVDALVQEVNALKQERASKQADIASKERIAEMDNQTKAAIEAAKLDLELKKLEIDLALERLKLETDVRKAEITAKADAEARREGFAHDKAMGAAHAAATAHPASPEMQA